LQLAQEIVRDRERAERIWRAANQIAGVSGTLAREDGQKKVNSATATANGAGGAVGNSGTWVATVDPDSGSTYYWNEATGETRWTDPAAPEGAAAAATAATAAAPAAGKADATGTAAAAAAAAATGGGEYACMFRMFEFLVLLGRSFRDLLGHRIII
jgi:hypothetical protein